MFNCDEYFNSLSLDTIKIDVSNKDLSHLPDIFRFTKLQELNCSFNKLTSLQPKVVEPFMASPKLNKNLQSLYCYNNQLESLPTLNNNLQTLNCSIFFINNLPLASCL